MLTPARVSLIATAAMVALKDCSTLSRLIFVTEQAMYRYICVIHGEV